MRLANFLGIILSGVCLGTLTGLSVSPVIQSVLTALITIITAVLTFTSGINDSKFTTIIQKRVAKINFIPTAGFILFFTLGSFVGIYLRTNDLLGKSVDNKIQLYKDIGFTGKEIKQLFASEFKNQLNERESSDQSVLYSNLTEDELGFIRLKSGKALEVELRALNNPSIDAFLNITSDSIALEALKLYLCTK